MSSTALLSSPACYSSPPNEMPEGRSQNREFTMGFLPHTGSAFPPPGCILPAWHLTFSYGYLWKTPPLNSWLHPSHHSGWSFPDYSVSLYQTPRSLPLLFNSSHWHPLVFHGPSLFHTTCTVPLKAELQEICLSQAHRPMSPRC